MSYETLDNLADMYIPLLLICALISAFWQGQRHPTQKTRWICTSIIELAIYLSLVYGLKYFDIRFGLWPSLGWDYSTHTAFALAMVWPLWLYQATPWRWVWPVSFVIYAALMMYQRYHTFVDIISTAAVIVILMAGFQRLFRPKTIYLPRLSSL